MKTNKAQSNLTQAFSPMRRVAWWYAWSFAAIDTGLFVATVQLCRIYFAQWTNFPAAVWPAGAMGLFALLRGGFALWSVQRLRSPLAAATMAENLQPKLGSAASTAVALTARQPPSEASAALCAQHVRTTISTLTKVNLAALVARRHRRAVRGRAAVAACGALACLLCMASSPKARAWMLQTLLGRAQWTPSAAPLVGNISLKIIAPAYTKRPPLLVPDSDGDMQVLAGSVVEITATADVPVQSAAIFLSEAAAPGATSATRIAVQAEDGRHLRGRLTPLRHSTYAFAVTRQDGQSLIESRRHAIVVQADERPQVFIDSPPQHLTLHAPQMLPLHWRANDDFGITHVKLVASLPQRPEPVELTLLAAEAEQPQRLEATYSWALEALSLAPGQTLDYHLEAYDNDAQQGGKKASSSQHTLTLFSPQAFHQALLTQQQHLLHQLVLFLSDLLLHNNVDTSLSSLLDALADLPQNLSEEGGQSATMQLAWQHLHKRLQATQKLLRGSPQGLSETAHQSVLQQTERSVIYLDDLLAVDRIEGMQSASKDLLTTQRELQDLLQQVRTKHSKQSPAQLTARIEQLREQMLQMLAAMARIKEGLPDAYRNAEAGAMSRTQTAVSQMQQHLRAGNFDAAAATLESLANVVQNMVDALRNAQNDVAGERYAAGRTQLQKFAKDFAALSADQSAATQRAQKMTANFQQSALRRIDENFASLIKKARAQRALANAALGQLSAVPELIDQLAQQQLRQRLADLDALLQQGDLAEAYKTTMQAQTQAYAIENILRDRKPPGPASHRVGAIKQQAKAMVSHIDQLADQLQKLFAPALDVLPAPQRAAMRDLATRQQALQQRSIRAERDLAQLRQVLPLFGDAAADELAQASALMGQAAASQSLGHMIQGGDQARRASAQLQAMQDALQRAAAGTGSQGMPLPWGVPKQGQGGHLQGFSKTSGGKPSELQSVEIPKTINGPSGPKYRQQLLDAAKQKPPAAFEEAVRRYYKELMK